MTDTQAQPNLRKKRVVNNSILLLMLIPCSILYHFSVPMMHLMSGLPENQIGDLGIEPVQTLFVAMLKLPVGIVFSALMANFMEGQMREGAFGNYSRWGVCFALFLFCFSQLAQK